MNRLENSNNFSKKKIVFNSFIGGIFWGAGSIIGAAIVIILFGYFASSSSFVPIIGNFIAEIGVYVESQKLETQNPFSSPQEN